MAKTFLISYVPEGETLSGFRREECESRQSAESRKALYSQEVPPRFAEVVEHEGDLMVLTGKSLPAIYNNLGLMLADEANRALQLAETDPAAKEAMTKAQAEAYEKAFRFKPVAGFKNVELGRKKLFAMVVGGGREEPVSADPAPPARTISRGAVIKENDTMATKTKAKKAPKAKKAAKPRVVAPLTAKLGAANAPGECATAGCYIRSLVMTGDLTNEAILKLVHKHFKDSTAKGSDISWNRAKLRAEGKKVPEIVKEAE